MPKPRIARIAPIVALACAALACARAPLGLDVTANGRGVAAILHLGFASVRFAFDSGQECSKSNGCEGPLSGAGSRILAAAALGTAVAKS